MSTPEAELEAQARQALTALFASTPVGFAVIGMQIFMCWFGLIIHNESHISNRKGRYGYIAASWSILFFYSMTQLGDAIEAFNVLANSASSLDAVTVWKSKYDTAWWRLASTICVWVINWIGDGMLVYRCYMIWNDRPWVTIVPGLAYLGACISSILVIVYRFKWVFNPEAGPGPYSYWLKAWIFLSVAVNCLVTGLISFRLLKARKELSGVLKPQDLQVYLGVVAILVESALPLSIFGLAFAALSAPANGGPRAIARTTMLLLWIAANALCPQMIIFRVTTGRSWVTKPQTNGFSMGTSISRNPESTQLEFNDPLSITISKTDPEISFSSSEKDSHRRTHALASVSEEEKTLSGSLYSEGGGRRRAGRPDL